MELISGGPHSSLERERKIFLRLLSTSPIKREIRYFHVVVVQCQERKCTKKCDAREELLFHVVLLDKPIVFIFTILALVAVAVALAKAPL